MINGRSQSPIKTGHSREVDIEFTKRLSLLRKTTGIREEDVQDFQKTEILRQSIATVREAAAKQEQTRLSPRKYQTVKSKVAGNMKSQKRAKMRTYKQQAAAEQEEKTLAYIMSDGRVEKQNEPITSGSQNHHKFTESPNSKARANEIQQKMEELNGLASELEQRRKQAKQRASQYQTSPLKNASNYNNHTEYRASVMENLNKQVNANYQTQDDPKSISVEVNEYQKAQQTQERASCSPFRKQKPSQQTVQSEFNGPVEQSNQIISKSVSGSIFFEESRAQKLLERGNDRSCSQSQYTDQQNENQQYEQQSESRSSKRPSSKYISPYKQQIQKKTTMRKSAKKQAVSSILPDEPPMPVQYQIAAYSPQKEFTHQRPRSSLSPTKSKKSVSPVKKVVKKKESRRSPQPRIQETYQESMPIQIEQPRISPARSHVQINSELKMGNAKFRNTELEARTAKLEAEFNRVLNSNGENYQTQESANMKDDEFYKVMGEFYGSNLKRHESPTRRLRQLKDSTVEHKTMIKNNYQPGQDYSLVYCSSPQKSYVIEPKGGELNYKLADKNPNKFYDQVMNQEITQHKVRKNKAMRQENKQAMQEQRATGSPVRKVHKKVPLEFTSKITKRKIGKVLEAVNFKLKALLVNKMGNQMSDEVMEAFKDQEVQNKINKAVKQRRISLVDQNRNNLFINEMDHIAKHGTKDAAMISPAKERPSLGKVDNLNLPEDKVDPNFTPSKADLACDDQAFDEVHNEVLKVIKRRSTLRDQQIDY